MRLPQFTAEASLDTASERYRLPPVPTAEAARVRPQLDAGLTGCVFKCHSDGISVRCVPVVCYEY
jgi:hypothetical protein